MSPALEQGAGGAGGAGVPAGFVDEGGTSAVAAAAEAFYDAWYNGDTEEMAYTKEALLEAVAARRSAPGCAMSSLTITIPVGMAPSEVADLHRGRRSRLRSGEGVHRAAVAGCRGRRTGAQAEWFADRHGLTGVCRLYTATVPPEGVLALIDDPVGRGEAEVVVDPRLLSRTWEVVR